VRPGQVAGSTHERVIVEDVKDAGYRLDDIVLTQLGFAAATAAAFAGPFATAPAVAEPASPPASTAVTVIVLLIRAATVLLATRALLVTVTVLVARI